MTFRPLLIVASIDNATATLTAPVTYTGRDDVFVIPAGFGTDFASVPQFCQWLLPTMGAYTRAAVLHDFLCTQLAAGDMRVTARDVDGIFRRVCREEGVPLVRRWLLWTGVRYGALMNPKRRPGIWRDMPLITLITLLAAPLIVPISLLCLLGVAIDRLVEGIAR